MGNLTQANSIACALEEAFALPPIVTGILLCAALLFPVLGSVKRIGRITEVLVPLMSFFYLLGAFIVIGTHFGQVPHAFSLIFRHAFTPIAPLGGFAGATVSLAMQKGISRGVFTNEAGLGSASIAHSAAETDSPVRQGLWGMFEVFFDTIFMCLITAVAILVSGVWQSGASGAVLTMSAFETALPHTGKYVIALSLTFFALSSIIAWSYYGRQCLNYLTGNKYERFYLLLYIAFAFLGANMGLTAVWELSDALNGLMALPNLFGLICLSPTVLALTREEKLRFLPKKRRKVPPISIKVS
jgi:AGCS family alanine or glycine:cation symporter